VVDGLFWGHAALRIPAETTSNEVQERLIVALKHLLESLGGRTAPTALGGDGQTRLAHAIEKQLPTCRLLDQVFLRRAENLHDTSQLFLFVLAREDGHPRVQLSQDTAERPHIDRQAIGHAKDNFRRAIEARLNVRINLLVFKAAGAKVDDLDFCVQRMAEQDVFGLQITVDDPVLLEQIEGAENLLGKPADQPKREATEGIRLDELVKIHVQKLGRDAEMAAEVETVSEVDHAMLVMRILRFISERVPPTPF